MPSKLLGTLLAAAVLSACVPASAITIGPIDTSSPNRVAVTVTWPLTPASADVDTSEPFSHPLGDVAGVLDSVLEQSLDPSIKLWRDGILVGSFYSSDLDRKLSDMTWSLFGLAAEVLPLSDGDEYGGIFVFGARYPHNGVPDNGASALLLSAGLAGLTLLRRTVV